MRLGRRAQLRRGNYLLGFERKLRERAKWREREKRLGPRKKGID